MRAVKKKRVLTVVQKPTGNKKDFGYIGFYPQPFAAFLVFPQSLKPAEGTRIIGIKYDLLELPEPQKPARAEPVKEPKPKPLPAPKPFRVQLRRTLEQELTIPVHALNPAEAKEIALSVESEKPMPVDTRKLKVRVLGIEEAD
jgi:hypothetical protein